MTVQVTIKPSGHSYRADPERSILQTAIDAGFILPYGCRNGACGSCKGKVLAGDVDYGDYQEKILTTEERSKGYALFCCARPKGDVTIECREVGSLKDIPVRTLPCRVQKIERAAEDVVILHLKLPANERLQFLAGQYIDFLLKDGKRRSFSIANAPHDDAYLQLHIRHIPGGQFTDHVFHAMKERDILRFEGPLGSFFLREQAAESPGKPIILVAGGTGFAPIKAIIEHAIHHQMKRQIALYWGARDRAGLYLHELAESWARTISGFKYVPVLSDSPPEDNWQGRTGLVHQAAIDDLRDLSAYQVYACGAPPMIEAAKKDFVRVCQLPEEEFFADSFTYAADSQPNR